MSKVFLVVAMIASMLVGTAAVAQEDKVWVQIQALPTIAEAEDRARAYSSAFPETAGFRVPSGWYVIVLGPYGVAEGAAQLNGLRREGLIPADSFIADGASFRDQFWPAGAGQSAVAPEATAEATPDAALVEEPQTLAEATPETPTPEATAANTPTIDEETPQQARASEADLGLEDRQMLQTAMQWFGFYNNKIDGAFGKGTRASMAAWQTAYGFEPTGILTTLQRATLVANYQADQAEYGFAPVVEADAGIDVTLPLGLVAFDHYEPPFVHFNEKAGSGLKIILISQPGDQATLYGLYDLLQTLSIMPLAGERTRGEKSFRISGASATVASTAFAELRAGLIKGWIVVSTPATADRDARIIQMIEGSFKSNGSLALDPGLVPMDAAVKQGLMSGLEVRRPKLSRSGFYIDGKGTVLTTIDAVQTCGRITVDRDHEARVTLSDAALGIAVLTPTAELAPMAVARLQLTPDRIGTEIAVAGYSWEDRLPSPVMTFGSLDDVVGLNGEPDLKRLSLQVLTGDAGGPVVDGTGAVLGMLLPDGPQGGKEMPAGVAFARSSAALANALRAGGVAVAEATPSGALAPEDLSRQTTGMTALVSCWD